jgi:hypothetical protein
LIAETRWVLIALYNVILNLTAVIPIAAVSLKSDDDLAILMMISIVFSGGGIVITFLLPRTLQKLFDSRKASKGSSGDTNTGAPGSPSNFPGQSTLANRSSPQMKAEHSRTPAEELSQRLENPEANYKQFPHTREDRPSRISPPNHEEVELLEPKKPIREEALSEIRSETDGETEDYVPGMHQSPKSMKSKSEEDFISSSMSYRGDGARHLASQQESPMGSPNESNSKENSRQDVTQDLTWSSNPLTGSPEL